MTNVKHIDDNYHSGPLIRSQLYKLLSLGYRYPTNKLFETLESGEFRTSVKNCFTAIQQVNIQTASNNFVKNAMKGLMVCGGLVDLEVEYIRIFDVGIPTPPCSPYEGEFRSDESRISLMMEIAEFYRHFGLQMKETELPDHICSELEFLHFLTFKEAQAGLNNDVELLHGYILAQKDFLERHLLKWISAFGIKIKENCKMPFYATLVKVTEDFISNDLVHVTEQLNNIANNTSATSP